MKRVSEKNINTSAYWDACYVQEAIGGKIRVDEARRKQLFRWLHVRIGEALSKEKGFSFLDVGCGLGEVLTLVDAVYSSTPRELWGVDLSHAAITACAKRMPDVQFEESTVLNLPFGKGKFDFVWCGETIEHTDSPDVAVRELARVTKPGGMLAISTPYRHQNSSDEHVFEFDPGDVCRWAGEIGEILFLDCLLLEKWLSMFAVFRKADL